MVCYTNFLMQHPLWSNPSGSTARGCVPVRGDRQWGIGRGGVVSTIQTERLTFKWSSRGGCP